MITRHSTSGVVALAVCLTGAACGPRLNVVTGTTVGLKASPGNGTALPQVTLAYKRAEGVVVPTMGGSAVPNSRDTYSVLGAYFLRTSWFDKTTVESFVATGPAAQNLAKPGSAFQQDFAKATLVPVDELLQQRREALANDPAAKDPQQAQRILDLAGLQKQAGLDSVRSLQSAIGDARTNEQITKLEDAFDRAKP